MPDYCMPSLGADMDSGKLVEWRVAPGDRVEKGDIVAVIETQKASMEIEFFDRGTIEELLVEPGDEVPVGAPIARFKKSDESAASSASVTPVHEPASKSAKPHVRMSPAARQRARELGLEQEGIRGSGPHGAVVLRDVEAAGAAAPEATTATPAGADAPAPAASTRAPTPAASLGVPATTVVPTSPLREAIGAAMSRSKREIPHYYLAHAISMRRALEWLRRENENLPVAERMLPAALLLKAVAGALWDVPELNGYWSEGQLLESEAVHLGTAIALRSGGVVAPAIHDAEQKSVAELMTALRSLVRRARTGKLKQSELTSATITVTSLGERGSDAVYGVINPPQVAIVGFGAITDRAWVDDGKVVVHPVVTATLSADHRASDGHRGGLFLAAIDRRLQSPEEL